MIAWDDFMRALASPNAGHDADMIRAIGELLALDFSDLENPGAMLRKLDSGEAECKAGEVIVDVLAEFEARRGSGGALVAIYEIANFINPRVFPSRLSDIESQRRASRLYADCMLAANAFLLSFNKRSK